MSIKQLKDEYGNLYRAIEDARAKKIELDGSEVLSEEGKRRALSEYLDGLDLAGKRGAVMSAIKEARREAYEGRKAETAARLSDSAYQARVAGAVGAIASGAVSAAPDVAAVAEMFASDPVAMSRLRDAAAQAGADSLPFASTDGYAKRDEALAKMALKIEMETVNMRGHLDHASQIVGGHLDYLDRIEGGDE